MNAYIENCDWESLAGFNDELSEIYARESALILGFDVVDVAIESDNNTKKSLLDKIKAAKEEAVKKVKTAAATVVLKVTLWMNTHEVAADFMKFIQGAYKTTSKAIAETTTVAKDFVLGIETKDDSLLIKAKDTLADLIEKHNNVTSDLAAKGVGIIKGAMQVTKKKEHDKLVDMLNEERAKLGKEGPIIDKEESLKTIVGLTARAAEYSAKQFLRGIDRLWGEVSRDTGKYSTSFVVNALQVFMNVFMLYGFIISTPLQVMAKMGISFAATTPTKK